MNDFEAFILVIINSLSFLFLGLTIGRSMKEKKKRQRKKD